MTDKEFEALKQDLGDYKRKKDEVKEKKEQIKKDIKEGRRMVWHEKELIGDLDKDFDQSTEKAKFDEYVKKTDTDTEFERNFRKAHSEVFLKQS